jgi:hypothetical protein
VGKPDSLLFNAGSALDGPYMSESICEAARVDRDDFSNLECKRLKVWRSIKLSQHGNVPLMLSTKWEDGEMQYRISISPISSQIKDARGKPFSTYTVIMQDADDFPVVKLSVRLAEATQIVDDKGNPKGLEYYGTQTMSAKSYGRIADWTLQWNF